MNGLALLGDALASGSADYANIKREQQLHERAAADEQRLHARGRAEHLQDVSQAQEYETKFRGDAWQHEGLLYKTRQWDAIKQQLVRDKLLDIKDAESNNIEAIQAALAKRGPDYERDLAELSAYKAAVPSIMKASKGRARLVEGIMQTGPEKIEEARAVMNMAYSVIGDIAKEEDQKSEKNKETGAALMTIHMAKLAELESKQGKIELDVDRLQSGSLTTDELALVQKTAMASPMLPVGLAAKLAKGKNPTPQEQSQIDAEKTKAETQFRNTAVFQKLKEQAVLATKTRSTITQLAGVKAAFESGLAGLMDVPKPEAEPAAPAAPSAATPPPGSAEDFLGVNKPKAAAAPTDEYGGMMGLGATVGRGIAGAGKLMEAAPKAIESFIGGDKFVREGQQYSDSIRSMAAENRARSAANMANMASAEKAEEDRVLTAEPQSYKAYLIRKKRGLSPGGATQAPPIDLSGGALIPAAMQP